MIRKLLVLILVVLATVSYAQESVIVEDSLSITKAKKWDTSLDVMSRYIWRGQSWGGNYVAVQPSINYNVYKKWTLGFWETHNLKNDYFYPVGISGKGYQEIDFNLCYAVNKYFEVQVWDYYWPSVERVNGIDNGFFNYGRDGVKTVDVNLLFDFTDVWKPFNATISVLVAGNDFRYDSFGNHPKQNFTTYFEVGYDQEFKMITLEPVIGVVLNNQAHYYTAGDYDKVSLVNLGLKASHEFEVGKRITIPIWLNYTHNAATKNTEVFGKNFLVAGVTFEYE